jgi:hypothetical protein
MEYFDEMYPWEKEVYVAWVIRDIQKEQEQLDKQSNDLRNA